MSEDNYCFQCRFFKPAELDVTDFDNTDYENTLEWANQHDGQEDRLSYDCCRYPPVHIGDREFVFTQLGSIFDWCGEFQPRPCYAPDWSAS